MKKSIAILLAICFIFCMTGCVTKGELDAVCTERDDLKETVDKYAPLIDAMESEEYETAIEIISKKQIDKAIAEKGNIDDYLVTVELTMDNFDDYLEWVYLFDINDFGETDKSVACVILTSKVFEQGLILYQSDAVLGYQMTVTQQSQRWGRDSLRYDEYTTELSLGGMDCVSSWSKPSELILEECSCDTTRVSGTLTFVKAEYVSSYELGTLSKDGTMQDATITLLNGETMYRSIWYGYKY